VGAWAFLSGPFGGVGIEEKKKKKKGRKKESREGVRQKKQISIVASSTL